MVDIYRVSVATRQGLTCGQLAEQLAEQQTIMRHKILCVYGNTEYAHIMGIQDTTCTPVSPCSVVLLFLRYASIVFL